MTRFAEDKIVVRPWSVDSLHDRFVMGQVYALKLKMDFRTVLNGHGVTRS